MVGKCGWSGGAYGVGERMSLKYTRAMITAAMNGDLDNVDYNTHEVFGLAMPTTCPNVPDESYSQETLGQTKMITTLRPIIWRRSSTVT